MIDVNVRNPLRVKWLCTAEVAKIIGIATRAAFDKWSVSTRWPEPERTASSASARIRSSPSCNAFGPAFLSKEQSISMGSASKFSFKVSHCAFPTKGDSRTRISDWGLLSSSTFFRFPKRVLRLITRNSRRLSIGGLVTCEKFWRK